MGMRLVHDNVVTINTLAVSEAPTYTFNSLFCTYQGFGEEEDGEWGETLGYPPQKPQILTL